MPTYRERLWPSVWMFVATSLVIPASLLVFLPISTAAGIVCAILLYAGCIVALLVASAPIEVGPDGLRAGRATLPPGAIGEITAIRGEDARLARGQRLDARAWLLIRGWIAPVVTVGVVDADDPTPYWLLSTRRPEELKAALEKMRSES